VPISQPESIAASRRILATPADVVRAAADEIVEAAMAAVVARGRFVIALSGGSTPRALYQLLATPAYAGGIPWPRTQIFWGDERCVPPDHADSNYRMAREALLDRVPLPVEQIHRIRGEDDPSAAAAAYEQDLRAMFPDGEDAPTFDCLLLGVGHNGHTASLFPGSPLIRERRAWVAAEFVAEVNMWRVTLTPPVLNAAARTLILVAGAEKAAVVRQILEEPPEPDRLPVQIIAARAGPVTWLLDAASAAQLQQFGPAR